MSCARVILHLDMDAFYAAIEQRDDPRLKGLPVLVGGTNGRGVVCAASYEARKFGCHSAMPMSQAVRLCPAAKVVRPCFEKYREVSRQVHDVMERVTPVIEPLSLDEAFLDCTGSTQLFGDGVAIAQRVRSLVKEQTGLTCSVGVAYNKFLAKLASDLNKPDGLAVVTPGTVRQVLDPLPVWRIWGVGPKLSQTLARYNIRTIGDLTRFDRDWFQAHLGVNGPRLRDLALGLDDRPVQTDQQAKSIGHEETFDTNIATLDDLRTILLEQVEQVATRLRRRQLLCRSVSLKLRDGEFHTITRQVTLDVPTDLTKLLWHASQKLLETWGREHFVPLRLMGVSLSQLSTSGQLGLFDQVSNEKARQVDRVVDHIRNKFGQDKIGRKA